MNLILIFLFLLTGQAGGQKQFDLSVLVTGIEPNTGNVIVSVYNNEKDFLWEGKEFRIQVVKAREDTDTLVFKGLPKGEYAVAIYQDRNGDGKMNKNFMGIPKEIYGFSQNFRPLISKPHFDDCRFELKNNLTITVKLK